MWRIQPECTGMLSLGAKRPRPETDHTPHLALSLRLCGKIPSLHYFTSCCYRCSVNLIVMLLVCLGDNPIAFSKYINISMGGKRNYPNWGFSVLFPQLQGKCQGITSQDVALPALSQIVVLFYVLFVLCRSVYRLCVNVYCTTSTGWKPNFI